MPLRVHKENDNQYNMYKCRYCGKEFEKKQQLAGHIIWCKENPNKTGKSNFSNRKNDIIQDNYFGDELFELGIIEGYRNVYNNVLSKYRIKHKLL